MEPQDPQSQQTQSDPAQPSHARRRLGSATLSRTFAALEIPGYRWYWFGTAAAFLGIQMQMPATSWLAYELTGSPFLLGLVSAGWGVPMLTLSLFGGALTDRMDKKKLLLLSQSVLAVINLVMAVLLSLDLVQFWHLMVLASVSGAVFAFNMPPRQAIVPELVPRERLFNAITLSSGVMNATRVIGPSLAGVLMAVVGMEGAFYAATGAILVAVLLLTKLPRTIKPEKARAKVSMGRDIIQGLAYIRSHPLVLTLLSMVVVMVLFGMPYQNLMPVFAEILYVEELGFGFLMSMTGVGAVVGSLVIANLGDFKRKGALSLACGVAFGLMLIVFANLKSLPLALPMLMIVGAVSTSFMSVNNTLIQMNITDEVRGRVMSVYMMSFGLMPLGTLPMGAIAESMGAPFAITIAGGALVVFVLLLTVLRPVLWRLE